LLLVYLVAMGLIPIPTAILIVIFIFVIVVVVVLVILMGGFKILSRSNDNSDILNDQETQEHPKPVKPDDPEPADNNPET
jgi:uncharacterized membrane protein